MQRKFPFFPLEFRAVWLMIYNRPSVCLAAILLVVGVSPFSWHRSDLVLSLQENAILLWLVQSTVPAASSPYNIKYYFVSHYIAPHHLVSQFALKLWTIMLTICIHKLLNPFPAEFNLDTEMSNASTAL